MISYLTVVGFRLKKEKDPASRSLTSMGGKNHKNVSEKEAGQILFLDCSVAVIHSTSNVAATFKPALPRNGRAEEEVGAGGAQDRPLEGKSWADERDECESPFRSGSTTFSLFIL